MNGNKLMLIHLHIDSGQSRRDSSKLFHNALYKIFRLLEYMSQENTTSAFLLQNVMFNSMLLDFF